MYGISNSSVILVSYRKIAALNTCNVKLYLIFVKIFLNPPDVETLKISETSMQASNRTSLIPGIYMDVFQEALYEIGRLWEANQITVADEHMGTAITQFVMSNLYQHIEIADEQRGKLVMTGVQGELHQVGANMVADVLEADGWDVTFLGTNVPAEGVIQSIRQQRPDLFGISSTMLFNIPKVIQLVEVVRKEFGNGVNIMLGGGAFRTIQEMPGELSSCKVALDLREALDLTRSGM